MDIGTSTVFCVIDFLRTLVEYFTAWRILRTGEYKMGREKVFCSSAV